MIELLEKHREAIIGLCRRFGVRRLEVFGSAASGSFHSKSSDVDFFYELDHESESGLADRYFGFRESLEVLLGVSVDLVSALDARNPYFLEVANRSRIQLYAA